MPKQESIAERLRENAKRPLLIICGGAIIDFLGKKIERAPVWMRRARIEWIYRLWREPKRLFRRYVVGNPVFIGRAVFYRIQGRFGWPFLKRRSG
jgi:N-acetylglucosaminyldiphosphoundecaprenol N-acetyl-beta-D-mannosaminyltransferase